MTIDTEEEWDWDAGWPVKSYSVNNVSKLELFQLLCADKGVKTTWFTNWAVMHDSVACDTMLGIAERTGVELGMHIHPWISPPPGPRSYASSRDSYLHNAPRDEALAKLEGVYETFVKRGVRPRTFRGGRYSSGGAIHEFLLEKGFVADCSVVPFTRWPEDGAPDFFDRDLQPIRVATNATGDGLWELPLSLGFTRSGFRKWANRFERIEKSWLGRLRLIGVLGKLGVVRRVWLNFEDTPVDDMLALLQVLHAMDLPCICFTVHSSSLYLGGNPYSQTEWRVKQIWDNVETVFSVISTWEDAQSATASEISQFLEADFINSKRLATESSLCTV